MSSCRNNRRDILTMTRIAAIMSVVFISSQTMGAILVPPGLEPGDKYHLVFNSSTVRIGTSGDINVYNQHVQAAADAADIGSSVGVRWFAISSTADADARDNAVIGANTPVYNMNLELVATGFADMWDGTLTSDLAYDELGERNAFDAWTGTAIDGTGDSDFTVGHEGGFAWCGRPTFTDLQWTNFLKPATSLQLGVFALSEELPEPTSLALAALGALGAFWRPRRRRSR